MNINACDIGESNVGIQGKRLVACLLSQGYKKVTDVIYDSRLKYEGQEVIMRFRLENQDLSLLYGSVMVYYRVVGADTKFEQIGVGDLRSMRIAPMGKVLGIRSLAKKQRFDRAKYRRNIREGKAEYKRGDK